MQITSPKNCVGAHWKLRYHYVKMSQMESV